MPSEFYDIDSLERYLTRRMAEEERAAFEGRLQQEEDLRRELAAYRPLLESFRALRAEDFRLQMQSWEEQWAQAGTDETELIEWYLDGELPGPARRRVEQRMAEDEAFSREVAAYRQLREGFDAARTEDFRTKLERWEKDRPARTARLWPRLAAAAAVLLLIGLGFNWYVQANFSAEAIAEAYYQPPPGGATMGEAPGLPEAVSQRFEAANRLFKEGRYPEAFQAFDALLAELPAAPIDELTRTFYRENSEWSRLLAALGMNAGQSPAQPPAFDLRAEARRIAATEGHEFQEPARALLRKLDSPLYHWAN